MPLVAIVELVVHLQSFQNVELWHNGVYRVEVMVSQADPVWNDMGRAMPYALISAQAAANSIAGTVHIADSDQLKEPAVLYEARQSYFSRSFFVRYTGETFDVNDVIVFRLQQDSSRLHDTVMLDFNLYRAAIKEQEEGGIARITPYEQVATSKYRLRTVANGIHACLPVVFNVSHMCKLQCSLHTANIDSKFKMTPSRDSPRPPKWLGALPHVGDVPLLAAILDNPAAASAQSAEQAAVPAQGQAPPEPPQRRTAFAPFSRLGSRKQVPPPPSPAASSASADTTPDPDVEAAVAASPATLPTFAAAAATSLQEWLFPGASTTLTPSQVCDAHQLMVKPLILSYTRLRQFARDNIMLPESIPDFKRGTSDPSPSGGSFNSLSGLSAMSGLPRVGSIPRLQDLSRQDSTGNVPELQMPDSPEATESAAEAMHDGTEPSAPSPDASLLDAYEATGVATPQYKSVLLRLNRQFSPAAVTALIEADAHHVAEQLFLEWQTVLKSITTCKARVTRQMLLAWRRHNLELVQQCIVRQSQPSSSFHDGKAPAAVATEAHKVAEVIMQHAADSAVAPVTSIGLFDPATLPVIIETTYLPEESKEAPHAPVTIQSAGQSTVSAVDVVVLLNGLHGSNLDMRGVSGVFRILHPRLRFCVSSANEAAATDEHIGRCALRLVVEVQAFIQKLVAQDKCRLGRLSFIGHSLGGLIVRVALLHPYMKTLWPHLGAFITLSTPHLGVANGRVGMVQAGMFVLRKMRSSTSLAQLSLVDSPQVARTFLYLLNEGAQALQDTVDQVFAASKRADTPDPSDARVSTPEPELVKTASSSSERGASAPSTPRAGPPPVNPLSMFQHLVLVGSRQDTYCACHSAWASACSGSETQKTMGRLMWQGVNLTRVRRLDVHFQFAKTSVDTVVGRAAHIEFLTSMPFLWQLSVAYGNLLSAPATAT